MDILRLHYLWLQQAAFCLRRREAELASCIIGFNVMLYWSLAIYRKNDLTFIWRLHAENHFLFTLAWSRMSSQELVVSFLPVLTETEMLFFLCWTSHPKHKHLWTILWVCRWLAAVRVSERRQQVVFRKDCSSIHSQAARLLHRRVWWEHKVMENEVGFLKTQRLLGKTRFCKVIIFHVLYNATKSSFLNAIVAIWVACIG